MKKLIKSLTIIDYVVIVVIGLIFVVLVVPFPRHYPSLNNAFTRSNLKQLTVAILIYQSDYDDRIPHATSMPTFRAQIDPYVKNKSVYNGIKNYSQNPTLNFNVSGISIPENASVPLAATSAPLPPEQVLTLYTLITDPKSKDFCFAAYADTHAKPLKQPQQLTYALSFQFDRIGVTLAPADYLADQDPLKAN